MTDFANWYRQQFKDLSPSHVVFSDMSFWYMNKDFRANFIIENDNLYLNDLRFYDDKFVENDFLFADKRRTLIRTVPAQIDGLVLENKILAAKNTKTIKAEERNSNISLKTGDGSEILIDEGGIKINDKYFQPAKKEDKISFKNSLNHKSVPFIKIVLQLTEFLPKILTSTINNKNVVGMAIGKESLLGFEYYPLRFGIFSYPFQTLAFFRRFPNPNFSFLFTSDSKYQAQERQKEFPKSELIQRLEIDISQINKKRQTYMRILENSDYTLWIDL